MDGTPPALPEPAPRGLRARFLAWRDRMIARPAFQDWAAGFPLTRGIARRRALELFDLTAGFVYSQVLHAVVELEIPERLAQSPQTTDQIAAATGLAPEPAERLMAAAASLGLVAQDGAHWRLGQLGAALLGAPGVAEMIRHHALLYRDLSDPVALLRGETAPGLARYWGYVGGVRTNALQPGETAPYTRLMAATQAMVSAEVLASYNFRRHRHHLDIGGGDGTFLRAVGAKARHLRLTLFDLPAVAAEAETRFAEEGLADRASARGGDFFADPLPEGADLVSLVRVIYDHDDEAALRLLARAREVVAPGGRLLLAEPMAETPGAPRVGDAYFGFYIMAMTHGRPRSAARLSAMLTEAGFHNIRTHRTRRPFLTGLLSAEPVRQGGS
ncbi:MAG: methyltransferase [Pseudomonadota bacterium]